ncbi:MAG TPA: hypothetical protein VK630_04195 [Reyranella sp.]|nr:hypothetical protein [Reyranella sp.]
MFAHLIGHLCGDHAEQTFRQQAAERKRIVDEAYERMAQRYGQRSAGLWRRMALAMLVRLDDSPITETLQRPDGDGGLPHGDG